MQIRFGLFLHELTYPEFVEHVEHTFGPQTFLTWAEQQLGLQYPEQQDHLRQEQYRQILAAFLAAHPNAFFAQSFEADALGTASQLLAMRDELLLAGWNFLPQPHTPPRLQTFAQVEEWLQSSRITTIHKGFAERFRQLEHTITLRPLPLEVIYLNEPQHLQPPCWQRLWNTLAQQGVAFRPIHIQKNIPQSNLSDLETLQQRLIYNTNPAPQIPRADGSLIILKANRQSDASYFLAKLHQANPQFHPVCLVNRQQSLQLDIAMIRNGSPSLGIASSSLARPTLQLLQLASAFLFKPINPYKLLEFFSLPNKPLHDGLARKIADVIAKRPGLFSPAWNSAVATFFDELREQIQQQPQRTKELRAELRQAEEQYNFWLARRRRYDTIRERVPAKACAEIYQYLQDWAAEQIDSLKEKIKKLEERSEKLRQDPTSAPERLLYLQSQIEYTQQAQIPLANLLSQATKVVQILDTLPPQATLNPLEIERIIRNVQQPAPMALRQKEVGHWPYFCHSSAITHTADTILWTDFVQSEAIDLFSQWYQTEQAYLHNLHAAPETPQSRHQRRLWQARRPVAAAKNQLILVIPQNIAGQNANAHPFWSDLRAIWGDALNNITYNIQLAQPQSTPPSRSHTWLSQFFILPDYQNINPTIISPPKSFIQLPNTQNIDWHRDEESFTSIDALIYTPYDWVFKHKIDLRKSSILSVNNDDVIKGNIAHALLNELFTLLKDAAVSWTTTFTANWYDNHIPKYIDSEGATLQMYGKEAERTAFVAELRTATVALVDAIQQNNWTIIGSEIELQGSIANQPIKGNIDLLLQRNTELCVVDIKWSRASKYTKRFDNNEDLQLVIYSALACQQKDWAHTAYFSLRDAKFVARNQQAFRQALCNAKNPPLDFKLIHQDIWNKIENTYLWRIQQLQQGLIPLHENHNLDEDIPQPLLVQDFTQLLETHNSKKANYSIYKNLLALD